MVEITESKVEKMFDYAEKLMKYGGKLMECLEDLPNGEGMGQRSRDYDDEDYDDYDDMGERGGYGRGRGGSNRGGYGERLSLIHI